MGKSAASKGAGCGCVLLIPLIFLMVGGAWLYFSIARVANQSTATGVVVDIDTSRDSDGDTSYRPVVEFVAENGQTYRFTGRTGSSSRPTVGEPIDVLYDPADPQGATEKTFTNLWLFPLIFGGIGLLVFGFMVFGRAKAKRRSIGGTVVGEAELAEALDDLFERGALADPEDELPPHARAPTQDAPPVGGATAEFRRAEASIESDGTMKYRIVAKDDAGNEYYSDLLDEDPTVAIMKQGNDVSLVQRRDGWVVEFEMPDDD